LPKGRNVVNPDRFLAFGFGVVFCGILAYAGLRGQPVSDPGQFWILRVLASISAAGVAAVVPGFLAVRLSIMTGAIVRGGGALAVFATVYLVNPPHVVSSASTEKEVEMIGDYKSDRLNDAEREADAILLKEPHNPKALNVKGGIEFYRKNFQRARELFEQAHNYDPGDIFYPMNLAYAEIEVGAPLKAIETLSHINDGKPDWYYAVGRAELYAGDFPAAERDLELVPDDLSHGAARFLKAAAIAAQCAEHPGRKEDVIRNMKMAMAQGAGYWEQALAGTLRERSQTFEVPVALIKRFLASGVDIESILPDQPQVSLLNQGLYPIKSHYLR
jgi:hypothetical protein